MPQEPESPELSKWEVQHLQLIAFPLKPSVDVQQSWWKDLFGEEPSDFARIGKKHIREEKGSCRGMSLSLIVDLVRIMWIATLAPELDEPPTPLMTIGTFPERCEWFQDVMRRWLAASCPPVTRLGFACKLLRPVEDHEAGYRMLGNYLPAVKVDPKSFDFLYRVNRPKPSNSGVQHLGINRLSTWGVMKYTQVAQVSFGTSFQPSNPEDVFACSVDLDINTVPDHPGELPRNALPTLFGELVRMGSDIAAKGDVS